MLRIRPCISQNYKKLQQKKSLYKLNITLKNQPFCQNDVIFIIFDVICPQSTIYFYFFQSQNGESRYVIADQNILLFSPPKHWIPVCNLRPTHFTFFAAGTRHSAVQSATKNFTFFSARSRRNSAFSRRKLLLFSMCSVDGFLTEAVFTFFRV